MTLRLIVVLCNRYDKNQIKTSKKTYTNRFEKRRLLKHVKEAISKSMKIFLNSKLERIMHKILFAEENERICIKSLIVWRIFKPSVITSRDEQFSNSKIYESQWIWTNRIIHNVSFLWVDQRILKRKKYTKTNNICHTTNGQQIPVKYSTEDE